MEEIFTKIYETSEWGKTYNTEFNGSSGPGSDIEFNINTYIPFLKKCIVNNDIKSVVDLGCGDFRCGHLIYDDLDVSYTGYDAYEKMIKHHITKYDSQKYNFVHLDFCNKPQEIISADMCILKDVLQHWNTANIYRFLDYIVSSKKFKYILIINCNYQSYDDEDVHDGGWRQLNSNFYPLKKYNPKVMYKYSTKECSVIDCTE